MNRRTIISASLSALFVFSYCGCSDAPLQSIDGGQDASDSFVAADVGNADFGPALDKGATPLPDAPAADLPPQNLPGQALVNAINDYRESKGLSRITYSPSLSAVAQAHVDDLDANHQSTVTDSCNMHSWSDKGTWSSCCYTSDHAKAQCMWDKPQELTSYTGNGFEIAYWSSWTPSADDALQGWITSSGHHNVMISAPPWDSPPWKAMGAAIGKNYAAAWFGNEIDPGR